MFHVDTVFDVLHSCCGTFSSASTDLVIFLFLPLNSFFNIFADLMNLFLSPLFFEVDERVCDRLCGALNSCIPDVHSYFIYRFLQELCNLRLGRFTVESCYHCFSLILINMFSFDNFISVFIFFIHVQDFSSMFVILVLKCLYLSSPSSFIFTMDEFIPWI